jgi:hypothetical protein
MAEPVRVPTNALVEGRLCPLKQPLDESAVSTQFGGHRTRHHLLRKAVTPGVAGDAAHSTLISVATYSPWLVDPEFQRVYKAVGDYAAAGRDSVVQIVAAR